MHSRQGADDDSRSFGFFNAKCINRSFFIMIFKKS